ncbi:MAG: T9SS type A sorting domain-containing protein [Flavobacteriales bacterium]|nr:T9SS type A sorting domain-containing protein [Flavobacteriales bacterium]
MKHALLLFALIATQAQAQIIYTDVIPDATYTGTNDTCSLDLDNDGNIDFLIVQRTVNAPCPNGPGLNCVATNTRPRSWVNITPQGTNAVVNAASFASQLPEWQAIAPALSWNNAVAQVLMTQGSPTCIMSQFGGLGQWVCNLGSFTGAWSGGASVNSPMFLGLQFDIAGSTFYGWARSSIPANGTSFTLMDYAYNSLPGEGILAGDMGSISTGITSSALRGMQLSPNPFSSTLNIALPTGTPDNVRCRVLSLTGHELLTRTVAATIGPSSITLDLASLAPGTYLLEMQMDGERIVRKVVKE